MCWVSDTTGSKFEALHVCRKDSELEHLVKIGVCHGCFLKLNAAGDVVTVLRDSLARLGQCKRGTNTSGTKS